MFETPTDLNGTIDMLNSDVSCTVQRGSNTSDFFIMNHFAHGSSGMASKEAAAVQNSLTIIRQRLTACRNKFERDPSLLAVDYWSYGDALEMVNKRNEHLATNSSGARGANMSLHKRCMISHGSTLQLVFIQ